MYEVMVEDTFSAAHQLHGYDGKCEKIHGHNWKVQVYIRSKTLDKLGFVMDFTELKKILYSVIIEFDHVHLNHLTYFQDKNPTAENIAFVILKNISKKLNTSSSLVYKVTIFESERSAATVYSE